MAINHVMQLTPGTKVAYQGKKYIIKFPLSLDNVLIEEINGERSLQVKISELKPIITIRNSESLPTINALAISEEDWKKAKLRESIIRPLAELSQCPLPLAKEASISLGVSWRFIHLFNATEILESNYQHYCLLSLRVGKIKVDWIKMLKLS